MWSQIPLPNLSQNFNILLTGHILCDNAGGIHHTGYLYGTVKYSTYFSTPFDINDVGMDGRIIVTTTGIYSDESDWTNYRSQSINIFTSSIYHEIGHLYGTTDHYYQSESGRADCVYGLNHFNNNVCWDCLICNECKQTILNNRLRFSHP